MASLNDQFEHGRLPIKTLPYKDRKLSQCNELMIDYGVDGNYHIWITDHENPNVYHDITNKIIKEMLPEAEINANQFSITIDGERDPKLLKDLINFIWKRFTYANDPSGFVPERDIDLIYDPSTVNVLLQTTDGTIQLPITSADNVYDKNGNTIQSVLDGMYKLDFAVTYLYAEEENQTSFDFNYLFEDYPDLLEVRIGTTYVDHTRYGIEKHVNVEGHFSMGTLTFEEGIELGRRIDLVWLFNSAYEKGERVTYMSGSRIADSTIPICKLQKYSDSYYCNDGSSVATSKALANLYNDLTKAINANNQNLFYTYDYANTNNMIVANIDRAPSNGDIIVVTMSCKKLPSAKLILNGLQFNLVLPGGKVLDAGFRQNQVVKFKVGENVAIVLSGAINEIKSNKFIHDCEDQEEFIFFKKQLIDMGYCEGDLVHVYRNGVRLFQELDYRIEKRSDDDGNENEGIVLFVRTEQGERIVFEYLGLGGDQ